MNENPALPGEDPYAHKFAKEDHPASTVGVGPSRWYFVPSGEGHHAQVPQRPIPGSSADLDVVMKHCDFSMGKHVRDCLRMLREGASLMNVPRRHLLEGESYIFTENGSAVTTPSTPYVDFDSGNAARKSGLWGKKYDPPIHLPALPTYRTQAAGCDPEDPRIFHMFWTGSFTDKPYMAILSFLYTQNLGLHSAHDQTDPSICRPQLWVWVNQGHQPPGMSMSPTEADLRLWQQLHANPWAAPFLHPRFQDVVKFKLWNTVEQLDGVPELRGGWRRFKNEVLPRRAPGDHTDREPSRGPEFFGTETGHEARADGVRSPSAEEVGFGGASQAESAAGYDRPSVKLSDLVRFVLCHRYGGIYVDADTVFLRDWEELWGWRGAFAYRWSRLDRYNTAVLRLHRGSALGSLLLRTAVRNELDFHPIRITRYLKDAHMERLLLRLPDALFDPAWLNVEQYQRDRPAQPFFESFDDFFVTPPRSAAAPEALGFDGFFRGAFSYHYHNRWWTPFDPDRNFPDLSPELGVGIGYKPTQETVQDLSWAAVLKRTFEAYIRGERPNMYGEWLYL
ncbi:hypothetical protein EIP86_010488 [Pleurotus ostreatoroseus]|nr:hypothetical protein EIP86_010488 [Pleurotus ostreatoroseus]